MRLYHVSPTYNDASIRDNGVLTRYSQSAFRRLYFVERAWIDWAIQHVREQHECDSVTVWIIDVNRRSCFRLFNGQWFSAVDVPPNKVLGRLAVAEDGTVLI